MIIFIYGEDSFRSRQKLNELKVKFLAAVDPSGNSLVELSGEKAELSEMIEAINATSLLSKKRMVIIENLFFNKSDTVFGQMLDFLQRRPEAQDGNITVFKDSAVKTKKTKNKLEYLKIDSSGREKAVTQKQLPLFKYLLSQAHVQQFDLLSNTEVSAWIKKEVEKRGGKISLKAAQMLAWLIGSDLWQADQEIAKLISYKSASQLQLGKKEAAAIEVEDVELMVRGSFDENIFALTDAISNNNKALAGRLLEEQLRAGLTDTYLLNMFIRQFKILLRIKQALDDGQTSRQMASSLALHPFIVQKGISQARNFSLVFLKRILDQLVKIDFEMKTGRIDTLTGLNLLLAKI